MQHYVLFREYSRDEWQEYLSTFDIGNALAACRVLRSIGYKSYVESISISARDAAYALSPREEEKVRRRR